MFTFGTVAPLTTICKVPDPLVWSLQVTKLSCTLFGSATTENRPSGRRSLLTE